MLRKFVGAFDVDKVLASVHLIFVYHIKKTNLQKRDNSDNITT